MSSGLCGGWVRRPEPPEQRGVLWFLLQPLDRGRSDERGRQLSSCSQLCRKALCHRWRTRWQHLFRQGLEQMIPPATLLRWGRSCCQWFHLQEQTNNLERLFSFVSFGQQQCTWHVPYKGWSVYSYILSVGKPAIQQCHLDCGRKQVWFQMCWMVSTVTGLIWQKCQSRSSHWVWLNLETLIHNNRSDLADEHSHGALN